MSTTTISSRMTVEELLALPDDGVERDLIRGQLVERTMTRRSRRHARTTTNLAMALGIWKKQGPAPGGEVLTGDAAFCLGREPATTVGIDVAYLSAELAGQAPDRAFLIEGAPVLAVEILSPSDRHDEVFDKMELLLEFGAAVVWIVDPDVRTVSVHRSGAEPVLFTASQDLVGDPELPGFRVKVAELFAR